MQISNETFEILKNFAMINPSIALNPGSILQTVAPSKTVMAKATVDETFPSEGAIYDLNRFLGVLSLFDEPDLIFNTNLVTVSKEKTSKLCSTTISLSPSCLSITALPVCKVTSPIDAKLLLTFVAKIVRVKSMSPIINRNVCI